MSASVLTTEHTVNAVTASTTEPSTVFTFDGIRWNRLTTERAISGA
jgi:hypothetical protein